MKSIISLLALTLAMLLTMGCGARETRTTVIRETTVGRAPVTREVITTLPTGYRVTTVRGARYYTVGNVYYQTAPGGYIIVPSPLL